MTTLVRAYKLNDLNDNNRIVIEVAVAKGDPRFKDASRMLGAIYAVVLSADHTYPYADDFFDLCHLRAPDGSKWLDMIVAPGRFLERVNEEMEELDARSEMPPAFAASAHVPARAATI